MAIAVKAFIQESEYVPCGAIRFKDPVPLTLASRQEGIKELEAARRDFQKDGGDSWEIRDGEVAYLGRAILPAEVLEMVNALT